MDELNAAGAPTVLISVSDHETGGLSLGYQLAESIYPVYAWYPDALTNATRTAHSVAESINARASTITIEEITGILKEQLGVSDPDDTELNSIFAQKDDAGLWNLGHAISRLTSRRAQLGWSTEGHSGVDCNLYGYPRSLVAKTLGGNRENTEVSLASRLAGQNNKQKNPQRMQRRRDAASTDYPPLAPHADRSFHRRDDEAQPAADHHRSPDQSEVVVQRS